MLFSDELRRNEAAMRFGTTCPVPSSFINLLARLHDNPAAFDPSDFEAYRLDELFVYLKASHRYYLDNSLPKIGQTTEQLRKKGGAGSVTTGLLSLFLDRYRGELETHIAYEEQVLFQFVEELLAGNYNARRKDFVLQHFLATHNDHVVLHLDQLKRDMIGSEAGLGSNLVFHVLFTQLQLFQNDLMVHQLIEDEVFLPRLLGYIRTNYPD